MPPGELPARMSTYTPPDIKMANVEKQAEIMLRCKPLLDINEALTGFCTHKDAMVKLSVLPEHEKLLYRKQYPYAHALFDAIDAIVKRWLATGKIMDAPPNCPFNSPLLAVPKKDDEGRMTGVRLCIDIRTLNMYLIEEDKFMIPHIPDVLAAFAGGKLFGEFDLHEAYFQFKLTLESQKYTAFSWNGRQYVFIACPYGIKHIPSLFQRFISNLFSDMKFVYPYIDNLGFASKDWEQHYKHAAAIIERLNSVNLRIKPSSYNLGNSHIKILGHIISAEGIIIDPEKQEMVMRWPRPVEGSVMATILGLCTFLRSHIRHYGDITYPLSKLTKCKKIEWTPMLIKHWELLKRAFSTAPILRFPDFGKRMVVGTDSSQTGVGGICYQPEDVENTITPDNIVAICSKQLDATQRNYPIYKKELWAVIYCLRKFHSLIWGRRDVTVLTDHKPLIHIANQKIMTVTLQQWADVLADYDIKIKYRPGILHFFADALSRVYTSSYQQRDVVWGTRTNLQFLKDFEKECSPSDMLCAQSIAAITPLTAIKKRHRIPSAHASQTGGGKDEVEEDSMQVEQDEITRTMQLEEQKVHLADLPYLRRAASELAAGIEDSDWDDEEDDGIVEIISDEDLAEFADAVECAPLYSFADPALIRVAMLAMNEGSKADKRTRTRAFTDAYHSGDSRYPLERVYTNAAFIREIEVKELLSDRETLMLAQEKRQKKGPSSDEHRRELLAQAHLQGHFGEKAMSSHIEREGYWWPAMRTDIAEAIAMCGDCRKFTITKSGFHPARSVTAFRPGDHYQIDLAQFPRTSKGEKYCLVLIDVFTGFIVLRALRRKTASVVARTLFEIFCILGIPRVLQSDNGPEFSNSILAALNALIGVPHRFIAAYNPRADGKVERAVQSVKQIIMKLMHGANLYWPLHLPFVMYCYNSKVQSLTGSTPFSLMYARMSYGAKDYRNDQITALPTDIRDWKKFQDEVVSLIYPAVAKRQGDAQAKYRQRIDSSHRKIEAPVADETVVMLKDPKYLLNPGMRPSYEPMFVGPYTVVRSGTHGSYVLKDELGVVTTRPVPLDQMKILYGPDNVPEQAAVVDNNDNTYVIKDIISHREMKGALEYLVQWKGYPKASDNDWVKAHNINDVAAINSYFRKAALQTELKRVRKQRIARIHVELILSSTRPIISNRDGACVAAVLRTENERE